MKKQVLYGIVVLLLLNTGGVARAAEEKGGVEVTAALKSWVNDWKREIPGTGSKTSDNIVLIGPAVEVEFHNGPVIEASYLMSASDYKFTEAGVTSSVDRQDLDLAIGKWLNHYVGFFLGYRNSSFKDKETKAKDYSYGLFYNLRGSVPLIGKSSLYANLTWLSTRFKAEGQPREEAPGWIAEIGGRTPFTEQLSMNLGYKWETTKGKNTQVKDTFTGMTLDLVYTF
jgi:hypothetical protein